MTLRIVQISDTHISAHEPQRLQDLKNAVTAINALSQPPELVVHTGDISHDGVPAEYQDAREVLDQLNAPYFVMPGNRDNRAELLKVFADHRYQLPAQGWVQYSIEQYGVRLVMVDTVSDSSNKGQLCDGRLANLESLLEADKQKPVALFLHHPPYEATGIPDPYQYEDWTDVEKLTSLLSRYSNICGMYCGHVHRFIDGQIAGIQASAMTCMAGDLRKGEVSDSHRSLPEFKELALSAKH